MNNEEKHYHFFVVQKENITAMDGRTVAVRMVLRKIMMKIIKWERKSMIAVPHD